MFFDDAVVGARELQITLTARHKDSGNPVPMCGVPHHSAANYIARLVRKGYRVAICEQTEDASKTKKLVKREVVRIVTPGTPLDPQLLDSREAVFLAAVCASGETIGAAFLDISTGEFRATQESGTNAWEKIRSALESYAPRELLFPVSLQPLISAGLSAKAQTAALPLGKGQRNPNQPRLQVTRRPPAMFHMSLVITLGRPAISSMPRLLRSRIGCGKRKIAPSSC